MKKSAIFIVALLLCIITNAISQTQLPCTGNTERSTNAIEKASFFNAVGVNINKYDWKNPTINCNINTAVKEYSKRSLLSTLGYTAIGVGIGLIGGGAALESRGVNILGILVAGGSIPLFMGAKKAKAKSQLHLQQVSDYYRINKLF